MPEIDGCEVDFEMVGAWFLKRIIESLPDVDALIFTVPVDSFESYRNWLSGVCEKLTVHQVRILDEPTAAALGYGINGGDETLLVVDFGGGTLDLSLVKLSFSQSNTEINQAKSPLGFLLKWGDRTIKIQPKALQQVTRKILKQQRCWLKLDKISVVLISTVGLLIIFIPSLACRKIL